VTVIVGMATIPSRIDVARQAIASLLPQCDAMHIHLDGHGTDDSWHAHARAIGFGFGAYFLGSPILDAGKRGAAWKFAVLEDDDVEDDDILLTCDDDFAYPPDYAATMLAALERAESANGRGCVVTAHGATHGRDWRTRHRDARAVHATRHMRRLNVPGTGVMAARVGTIRDYPIPTGGDCREDARFGVWCQREGVPIYAVPHAAGWLRDLMVDDERPKLHARPGHAAEVQCILDEVDEWRLHGAVIDDPPRLHGIFR